MGTYHCPTQQYRRAPFPPPQKKTCRASGALWGFLTFLSTPQTFHIHVGLFNGIAACIFLHCHLLPRFPPLLSGATFSTPAFSVAPVKGRCPLLRTDASWGYWETGGRLVTKGDIESEKGYRPPQPTGPQPTGPQPTGKSVECVSSPAESREPRSETHFGTF